MSSSTPALHIFKVGDAVTVYGYSDAHAATVVAVTRCTITIRHEKQTLLNGCNSGEPDALVCTPGGFVGHTSGQQRWAVEPDPQGYIEKCHLRSGAIVSSGGKKVGAGHRPHYDFNF